MNKYFISYVEVRDGIQTFKNGYVDVDGELELGERIYDVQDYLKGLNPDVKITILFFRKTY